MTLPRSACCDKHPDRIAVAKFRFIDFLGNERVERVCLNCGDLWWAAQSQTVRDSLKIEELTRQDLEPENATDTAP